MSGDALYISDSGEEFCADCADLMEEDMSLNITFRDFRCAGCGLYIGNGFDSEASLRR